MSAGPFNQTFYESDTGETHIIRVQPETLTATFNGATNDPPAGPATSPFWAQVTRGAREYGLKPRRIRIKWDEGGAPAGYKEDEALEIVVLSSSAFGNATINSAVAYLGGTGTVLGKSPENIYPGI